MRRTRVLWEAYVTRFEDAFDRYKKGRLTAEEAGERLGLSGRHFRRQCARYAEEGADGVACATLRSGSTRERKREKAANVANELRK